MKTILLILGLVIAIDKISKAQNRPPVVIISEIKVSPDDRFIEIRSERESVSLDGYSLVVLEHGKDRNKCNEEAQLRVRGVLSLNGKRTVGHFAFIGNI